MQLSGTNLGASTRTANRLAAAPAVALAVACVVGSEPGFAASDWLSPLVGGMGGKHFSLYCNTNSYLAGLRIRAGDDVDSVSPICGQLLEGGRRGQLSYYYKAGGNGGAEQDLVCPPQAPFMRALLVQGQGVETILVGGVSFLCGPVTGAMPTRVEGHNYFKVSTRYVSYGMTQNDARTLSCPNPNTAFSGLIGRAGAFVDALGVSCDKVALAANPHPFQPAATQWYSPVGGGDGGGPFATLCPPSTYIAGFNVRTGNDLDAIGPICATALRNGSRGNLIHQPQVGGTGGYLREMHCPSHIPFVRSVQVAWEGVDTRLVNSLYFICGTIKGPVPAAVKDQNHFGFRLHVQPWSSFGSRTKGGGRDLMCPDGMSYVGVHGRSGAFVDALGVICDNPKVALSSVGKKPPPPPVLSGKADGRAQDMPAIEAAPPVTNAPVTGEAGRARGEHTAIAETTATPESVIQPSQVIQGGKPVLHEPSATRMQTPATQEQAMAVPSNATTEAARSTGAARAATRRSSVGGAPDAGMQLVCRGEAGMLVQNSQSASAMSLPAGQKAYTVYFGVQDAGTNELGEGLQPGNCGLLGQRWTPGDPPAVEFRVDSTTQAPELWMSSADSYWALTIEKRHGYFEAMEPVQRLNEEPAAAGADAQTANEPAKDSTPANPATANKRGIIIVGGKAKRPGDDASLNPQPLPPKATQPVENSPARAAQPASRTTAPVQATPATQASGTAAKARARTGQ